MKGLLKKDFLLLKSVALPMVAILVMLLVSALVEYADIVYSFILWAMVIVTAVFNQDRFYRVEEFVSSIPNGKTKAIRARYSLAIIMILALTALTFGTLCINLLIHSDFSYELVPMITLVVIAFTVLGFAITLPLTYRFGIMKTSLISGFWAIAGMFVIFFGIEHFINKLVVSYGMSKMYLACGLLIFITLCLLYISYIISIRVYQRREK